MTLMPRVKLHASLLGVINLFLSGFSEKSLHNDHTGYHLSLFLFAHSVFYMLLVLSYFVGSNREVLHKTKIFPTHSFGRILFVVWSNVRHPFSIAMLSSNAVFLTVLYRIEFDIAMVAIALFLLLMLNICVAVSVVLLFLEGRNQLVGTAVVGLVLLIGMMVAASILSGGEAILNHLPLIGSVVSGILAAQNGDFTGVAQHASVLAIVSPAFVLMGKKLT